MTTPISILHHTVTPNILEFIKNHQGDDARKKHILETVYQLLLVRLLDSHVAKQIASLSDDELSDGELILKQLLSEKETSANETDMFNLLSQALVNRFQIGVELADILILTGLPLAYAKINTLAQEQGLMVDEFLRSNSYAITTTLPTWLTTLLPIKLVVSDTSPISEPVEPLNDKVFDNDHLSTHESPNHELSSNNSPNNSTTTPLTAPTDNDTPPQIQSINEPKIPPHPQTAPIQSKALKDLKPNKPLAKNKLLQSVLPLIIALVIALVLWGVVKSLQKTPTQVAKPPPPTTEQIAKAHVVPATMTITLNKTGDGVVKFEAEIGNRGNHLFEQQAQQATTSVFGVATQPQLVINGILANELPISPYFAQILGFMKGVPDAHLIVNDKTLRLWSSDAMRLEKLANDLKIALPDEFMILIQDPKQSAQPVQDNNLPKEIGHESDERVVDNTKTNRVNDEELIDLEGIELLPSEEIPSGD